MTVFHGDCVGPVGAKLYHGTCPHIWTSASGQRYVCECSCHPARAAVSAA